MSLVEYNYAFIRFPFSRALRLPSGGLVSRRHKEALEAALKELGEDKAEDKE